MLRTVFTYVAVISFGLIGVTALLEGGKNAVLVGVATICLSIANGIFLIVLA